MECNTKKSIWEWNFACIYIECTLHAIYMHAFSNKQRSVNLTICGSIKIHVFDLHLQNVHPQNL